MTHSRILLLSVNLMRLALIEAHRIAVILLGLFEQVFLSEDFTSNLSPVALLH